MIINEKKSVESIISYPHIEILFSSLLNTKKIIKNKTKKQKKNGKSKINEGNRA